MFFRALSCVFPHIRYTKLHVHYHHVLALRRWGSIGHRDASIVLYDLGHLDFQSGV